MKVNMTFLPNVVNVTMKDTITYRFETKINVLYPTVIYILIQVQIMLLKLK